MPRRVLVVLDVVPQPLQGHLDFSKGLALVVAEQGRYVLEHQVLGALGLKRADHVIDEIAVLAAVASQLLAGVRERLARETSAENVVVGDGIDIDVVDVKRRIHPEVVSIQAVQIRVYLASKYALVAEARQGQMKPTQSCEEIYEFHQLYDFSTIFA